IEAGAQYQLPKVPQLLIRGTLGFKFLLNPTENARTRITRFPVHLSANWVIKEDFRLGVGATNHLAAKVVGDGFVEDRDFDSSTGPRFEFAYKGFALSYTIINYTDQSDGEVFSANCFGISYSGTLTFNKKDK
ncbi:MAG: hypothetical protein AAFO94_19415, partial [Bacteroidota bacterium]